MARGQWIAATGVVIGVALGLAGCGTEEQPPSGGIPDKPPSTTTTSAADGTPAETAPAVPEQLKFTAKTVDGKDFNGESLAGKPAVLWFWASWCPKCQAEAEGVRAAADATSDGVTFLGVAAHSDVPAMQGFVDRYELGGFSHLADEGAAVWQQFGVVEQPAYAFVAADGTVEVVTDRVSAEDLLNRATTMAAE